MLGTNNSFCYKTFLGVVCGCLYSLRTIETERREMREWLARWRQRVETDFGGDEAVAQAAARRGLGERMDEEARTSNAIWRDQREDAVRRALKDPQ